MTEANTPPEDYMEQPQEEALIEVPLGNPDNIHQIDRVLEQVVSANRDLIVHEPTCIICASPGREDAEQIWIGNRNTGQVRNYFQSNCGAKISSDVIENHMLYHLGRGGKEIQKLEYIHRLQRLGSYNVTTLDRIRMGLSAITETLINVNSITPDSNTSEAEVAKIKSAETARLMGAFDRLLKLQASMLGEMKSSGEIITVPRSAFIQIFTDAIAEAKNDAEKGVINNLLDKLVELSKNLQ